MMRAFILALGLCCASALRIQAKKKETPSSPLKTPSHGESGTISFGRTSAPIYDVSDEPFQNIDFAHIHGTGTGTGASIADMDLDGQDEGVPSMNAKDKAKIIAEAMKACTPEASTDLMKKYPSQRITANGKSSLPAGSFYAKQADQHRSGSMGCNGDQCQIPSYLAPRQDAKEPQLIPRIIWMTLSDKLLAGQAGPFQYNILAEHFVQNPEYEWVVSGDRMSDAFMKSNEVKPAWSEAYFKSRNGAEKADIWRYAVLHKYGGVYMDSDMKAQAPYRTFMDPKAVVVQQMTEKPHGFEASQFALMFAPKHPLLESVLDEIAAKFQAGTPTELTIKLTGPGAFGRAWAMAKVCNMKLCSNGKHVCAAESKSGPIEEHCDTPAGKATMLTKGRDFNTGVVWHKADVCSLAESRSKVSHWAQQGKSAGGKGKGFEVTGKNFAETPMLR